MLEAQSRMLDSLCARAPALARLPRTRLTHVLQVAGVIALLALGVLIGDTAAWVLIAMPMTAIVLVILADSGELAATLSRGERIRTPAAGRHSARAGVWPPPGNDTPRVAVRPGVRH